MNRSGGYAAIAPMVCNLTEARNVGERVLESSRSNESKIDGHFTAMKLLLAKSPYPTARRRGK
jgi:hypothetical protein